MHTHKHTRARARPLISRDVGAVVYYAHNKAACKALRHHILLRNTTHLQKHRDSDFFFNFHYKANRMGRDNTVGTATHYGVDLPGIEYR
jgi:hypothetical protein